jgi:hypothetical protein
MRITPINMAEAIIEPFWDPELSGLAHWTIETGVEHGLQVRQNWCWAEFEWARKPRRGPALRMSRHIDVDCTSYDRLMVSVMAPERSVFRMSARTDRGEVAFESPPAPALKKEYVLDLRGASHIEAVTLEIDAGDEGIAAGWLNWLGLQNTALLSRLQAQWDRFDADWQPYLLPADFEPSFRPTYGLLINDVELDRLRERHAAFVRAHGSSPFTRAADEARGCTPEKMVRDFVNFWGDTRYCRERDHGNTLLGHGPVGLAVQAALAGLLLRDHELLRLGARFALALAMSGRWDDGFICYFPGGNFEHRCFVQSLCMHEAALMLDLAGECFTDAGREYIKRRIAEEGLGAIHFNTWKHEYIFHCNQLAWFTPGRMLGCAVLEQSWPRVRPYTELARNDLAESLGYAILSDGGYVEGPTYFRCVGRDGGLSLYYYARSRGLALRDVIPEPMRRTADFAAALASTDESADQIAICDATPIADQESLAVMAAALPASQWTAQYRKSVARTGGMPTSILACQLDGEIPLQAPEPAPCVRLPEMGILASVRKFGAETVKLLIPGNRAGAGHSHEDKGSFVLEFAGETFALDPGTCDYSHPLAGILKNCERHNMLIPTGMPERPAPQCPLPYDVRPQGRGDSVAFRAAIDASPGWQEYYRRWVRIWDSPAPDILVIHDEWELNAGDAVEFYWQTYRDVRVEAQNVTIRGKRGDVVVEAPAGCGVRVDELPVFGEGVLRRIVIRNAVKAGQMDVRVLLRARH